MNKIQKELYQAPELSKLELNNDLSILLSFSVDGSIDPIEEGVEDTYWSVNNLVGRALCSLHRYPWPRL